MTNQQNHLITPPPELVQQWDKECDSRNNSKIDNTFDALQLFASKAARWGSDQELEACCEWLRRSLPGYDKHYADYLREARRPKPPSLKEQALALVEQHEDGWRPSPKDWDTIRRALEQLPND